jgi:bzd-type benzoyl-CoA reductase Q subunit
MTTEYWRWSEQNWVSPAVDWKSGERITAGVDVGSVSSQAVVLVDGRLFTYSSLRTGSSSPLSATRALGAALAGTDLAPDRIQYTVGTGYGRVNVPFAQRTVTEIACHARGANFIYGPSVRTVLDMGGQDCKAIRCDEHGKVVSFLMNDKCAAGTGRGLEVLADILSVPLEEMGTLSLQNEQTGSEPPPVSSTCVIFAKSEATALMRQGWPAHRVLAAYCAAMAHRVCALLVRLGVQPQFAITGGIAKNVGIVRRIEKELGLTALIPTLDTQIAGALGAALIAADLAARSAP